MDRCRRRRRPLSHEVTRRCSSCLGSHGRGSMRDDGGVLTAVDLQLNKRRRRRWIIVAIIAVLALVGYSVYRQVMRIDVAVTYENDEDNFKYGSIGSDKEGIPYWIWKTMPEVCGRPDAIASLGVIQEPARDTPIG